MQIQTRLLLFANNIGPDQTAPVEQSDQGLHYLSFQSASFGRITTVVLNKMFPVRTLTVIVILDVKNLRMLMVHVRAFARMV